MMHKIYYFTLELNQILNSKIKLMFYEEPGKVVQTRPEAGNFPNVPN